MSAISTELKNKSTETGALDKLLGYFQELYGNQQNDLLNTFIEELKRFGESHEIETPKHDWYKDAVVYSIYVDLYAGNFNGLIDRLDYLQDLGVNVLWLLPVLNSPMRDAGFDISDYKMIRPDLAGLPANAPREDVLVVFNNFLKEARARGIRVIFDIAMNHTSDQHPWFLEAKKGEDNPFRDYYIWTKDTAKYADARIIFKGLCESNWQAEGDSYFFHRFFEFQPDLNYRNPDVLLTMARTLLFWVAQGVDGFRADAIPYIWKEEGTDCENLEKTHTVVKFFRSVLDVVRPGTLLLAEACQQPNEVVRYMGNGDECHAAYHFPVMPQIFKALAKQSNEPIQTTLSREVTPAIPENSQWFTFLRCHDELSLELVYVSEEDRAYIHNNYCHEKEWDFRLGEGISARMADLMQHDYRRVALAYAVMFALPGTPVMYYGDEFGKKNDHKFYHEQIKLTGKDDTRFLVRGRVDWKEVEAKLTNSESFEHNVFNRIKKLLNTRNRFQNFGRGSIEWLQAADKEGKTNTSILGFVRNYKGKQILVLNNLSDREQAFSVNGNMPSVASDLLGQTVHYNNLGELVLAPYQYTWIEL